MAKGFRACLVALLLTLAFLAAELAAFRLGLFGGGVRLYLVDSAFRLAFGGAATIVLFRVQANAARMYGGNIPAAAWLLLLPALVYFASYLTLLPVATRKAGGSPLLFCAMVLQQVTTGFFEETVSRGIVLSAFWSRRYQMRQRVLAVVASGVVFGLGHSLNFLFGGSVADSMLQALVTSLWGMYVAALYLLSGNQLFVMAFHAAWDVLVRLPGWFFVLSDGEAPLAACGEVVRTAIDPFLLGALAMFVCLRYDRLRGRGGAR